MSKLRFLLLLCAFPALASAHPHEWIDYTVTPETNARGELIALRERWQFDPLYAQMLVEGILKKKSYQAQKRAFYALEKSIAQTLGKAGGDTFPRAQFLPPQAIQLKNEQGALFLELRAPLRHPTRQLRYQIYEPSYYVEMLHAKTQPKHFANGCRLEVLPAHPDPEQVASAAALDLTPGSDQKAQMGHFFAETGVLHCEAAR